MDDKATITKTLGQKQCWNLDSRSKKTKKGKTNRPPKAV